MSQLLLLRGVFPAEFINGDIESIDTSKQLSASVYTPLVKRFTGVDEHPKFTNKKWWNCDLNFDTYPTVIPLAMEHNAGRLECDTEGNFHSWNCAVSWARSTRSKVELGDALAAITLVAALFGTKHVAPAPPKIMRKEYCGDSGLTREQYLNYAHGQILTGCYL